MSTIYNDIINTNVILKFYEHFIAPDYDIAPYEERYDSYGYAKARPVALKQQEHEYSYQHPKDANKLLDSEEHEYQSARPTLVSVVKKEIQAKLTSFKDIVLVILFLFFNLIVYLFYFLNYDITLGII